MFGLLGRFEQLVQRELQQRQQVRPLGVLEQTLVERFAACRVLLIVEPGRRRRPAHDLGKCRRIGRSEVIGSAVLLELLERRLVEKAVEQVRPQRGDDPHPLAAREQVEQLGKAWPHLLGKAEQFIELIDHQQQRDIDLALIAATLPLRARDRIKRADDRLERGGVDMGELRGKVFRPWKIARAQFRQRRRTALFVFG